LFASPDIAQQVVVDADGLLLVKNLLKSMNSQLYAIYWKSRNPKGKKTPRQAI